METKNHKKKKGAATTPAAADIKSLIHDNSAFFDKLIELIPARFYLPQADDSSDHPKPYFHGLSKAAKASLKLQYKENLKLVRRNRLDPDKFPQSSTLDLLQQSLQPPDAGIDADREESNSVTYEELRERLRRKIESLRGNRGGKAEEDKDSRVDRKKRRGIESEEGEKVNSGSGEGEAVIEYGNVRIGGENGEGRRKKKRKMSKEKELERAKRLEEVRRENPTVAEKDRWKFAKIRAMGEKVHDDPRLLKHSLKKEKKRREKNAEKWKERRDDQEKAKEARQKKRKENITEKIKETKMRKIAKREKKLMRPGFEGRKKDYITKD